MDVLNAVVGNKPKVLVHLRSKKEVWEPWRCTCVYTAAQTSCKYSKDLSHVSDSLPSHKHVKWDHNIYDLLQKLFV